MTGVQKLIKRGGGTPKAVAEDLSARGRKCQRQLVQYWQERGYITPKWAPFIHAQYGIPLHELNPSIYPKSAA